MEAIKAQAYTVSLPFFINGEYVEPDNFQATYTIYNNSGAPIAGYVNITSGVSGSYLSVNIPANVNTIANGLDFERRTVLMQFNHNGQNHKVIKNYMITEFYPLSVTAENVISYMGIKEGEIYPADLEITQAIFDIKKIMGSEIFNTFMVSGDHNNILLNDAIKYQTAHRAMANIELKILQKAGSESVSFARFQQIDFKAIAARVHSDLASAISQISGGSGAAFDTITLSNPLDIFTG